MLQVILTICCPQTAGSLVPGDRVPGPCGWLRSRVFGVSETAQVMLQDLMGALGAAVRPAEVSLSLCPRLSLHCGSLPLACSAGPGKGAAILGSAPSAGSRDVQKFLPLAGRGEGLLSGICQAWLQRLVPKSLCFAAVYSDTSPAAQTFKKKKIHIRIAVLVVQFGTGYYAVCINYWSRSNCLQPF